MEIYNENMERIEDPDLTLGYIRTGARTVQHEAVEGVEEKWHYEVVKEYPGGGRDIKKVIDVKGVPAREAWDEEIQIQVYVPYTQEELEAIEKGKDSLSVEERIEALEEENRQLKEAMDLLLSGETQEEAEADG